MWGIITSRKWRWHPLPRKWRWYPPVGLVLFALFLLALVLHTLFDRLTPYTSEATLQAPVVGVAPNVSGTIVSASVQDNQTVHVGDHLANSRRILCEEREVECRYCLISLHCDVAHGNT